MRNSVSVGTQSGLSDDDFGLVHSRENYSIPLKVKVTLCKMFHAEHSGCAKVEGMLITAFLIISHSLAGYHWQHVAAVPIDGESLIRESNRSIVASCIAADNQWIGVIYDLDPSYSVSYETIAACKAGVEEIVEKVK